MRYGALYVKNVERVGYVEGRVAQPDNIWLFPIKIETMRRSQNKGVGY